MEFANFVLTNLNVKSMALEMIVIRAFVTLLAKIIRIVRWMRLVLTTETVSIIVVLWILTVNQIFVHKYHGIQVLYVFLAHSLKIVMEMENVMMVYAFSLVLLKLKVKNVKLLKNVVWMVFARENNVQLTLTVVNLSVKILYAARILKA